MRLPAAPPRLPSMTDTTRLTAVLDRLLRERDSFLASAQALSTEQLRGPSDCDEWDRAHVVAHLASNSRALVNLVDWATSGEPKPIYSSRDERNRETDELAQLPPEQLLRTFVENSQYLAEQCGRLRGPLEVEELDLNGKTVPSVGIPTVWISELVLHHQDLNTGWTVAQAEPESQLNALEGAVRAMRAKGAPGMTLRTTEHDEWILGDGGQLVTGDRVGMVMWLARGDAQGVSSEGPLPELPEW